MTPNGSAPAACSNVLREAEDRGLRLVGVSANLAMDHVALSRRPACVWTYGTLSDAGLVRALKAAAGMPAERSTRAVYLQRHGRWFQELVESPLNPGLDLRRIRICSCIPMDARVSVMHFLLAKCLKRTRWMLSTRAAAGLRGDPMVFARTPDRRITVTRRSLAS